MKVKQMQEVIKQAVALKKILEEDIEYDIKKAKKDKEHHKKMEKKLTAYTKKFPDYLKKVKGERK